jgi:hypothetical protein
MFLDFCPLPTPTGLQIYIPEHAADNVITGDLRLIKPPLPQIVATDVGQKFMNPRPMDLRPHPDFEAPDANTSKIC